MKYLDKIDVKSVDINKIQLMLAARERDLEWASSHVSHLTREIDYLKDQLQKARNS